MRDGYVVYSALTPEETFDVVDTPDGKACSCDAFAAHSADPEYLCPHLKAVIQAVGIDEGDPAAGARGAVRGSQGTEHMVLKRSVSPDGKIDSLSIECAFPVEGLTTREIEAKAKGALALQSTVVGAFLTLGNGTAHARSTTSRTQARTNVRGRTNGAARSRAQAQNAVEAQMLDIESMKTSRGRCLCLNFEVDGDTIRYFGNKKKLAKVIQGAGYPDLAAEVTNGLELDVPCRVTLKDSANGDFEQVDEVFPVGG